MTDTILARIPTLKLMPNPQLKQQWRDLFETEPPPYNRRFLKHRLAYRIQELTYGGLKPETLKRLKALGVEHCVTVRDEDFEYQGRPYKSLSAVARAITDTRWNRLTFFGLKNWRSPL